MMSEVDVANQSDATCYEQHAPELVRYATVLVGPTGADDLVAESVMRAFAHPNWPHVENRRAYLFRAVLNEVRQFERASKRRRWREQRTATREAVESSPVRPEVLAAVAALEPRQRAIVFFTYWQDRTPGDIATELGVSTRTVQRELESAKNRLMEELR